MTDAYEEDPPPRKIKMSSNADLLEYRIEAMEREIRSFRNQADRKNKELDDMIQKRFHDLANDSQRLVKEVADNLEKKTRDIAETVEKKDREISDSHEKKVKEVEEDFDKRTSRIESFLLGGLCLVATLFIGALFAITNGTVPGGTGQ